MELKNLEKQLNFSFSDIKLLELALTHKSSSISSNNEKLEFLGDSLLNASISKYLFLKILNSSFPLKIVVRYNDSPRITTAG